MMRERRNRQRTRRVVRYGQMAVLPILILVLWELVVRAYSIPRALLPAPSTVAFFFVQNIDVILFHTWVTLQEVFLGFLFGSLLGFVSGVVTYYVRYLKRTFYPFMTLLYVVPKAALAPVFVIWFGTGMASKTLLALLLVYLPVLVNTYNGLQETHDEMVELSRLHDASPWFIFRHVQIPAASPFILASLKLGIVFAVIGAVVAEFISANQGIGALVIEYQTYARTAETLASIVTVIAMSLVLYYGMYWIERQLLFWYTGR